MNERRRTEGPLTPAQSTIIGALAAGRRQNEIAQHMGKSQQYISGEVQIITGKMGAKTTAEAVRIFATAQAYRNAGVQVRSAKIWSPVDAAEEHVNHVLDGIADLFQSWHDQRMPR